MMHLTDILKQEEINLYLFDAIGLRGSILTVTGPSRYASIMSVHNIVVSKGTNTVDLASLMLDTVMLKEFISMARGTP